jgi:hypothetical protein
MRSRSLRRRQEKKFFAFRLYQRNL